MSRDRRLLQSAVGCWAFLLVSAVSFCWGLEPAASGNHTPFKGTTILPLDEVRIGMQGYGLTVFQGTKIEPFRVQVVAVMRNFAPGRGLIWVRCPEPRMQKLGPVQGMSGSPIYLWSESDSSDHRPGVGGNLIGALALGFRATKDCFVGIQPIEQMRQVAHRAQTQTDLSDRSPQNENYPPSMSPRSLEALLSRGLPPSKTWRARAILRTAEHPLQSTMQPSIHGARQTYLPGPPQLDGQVFSMKLPMRVNSPDLATALGPILNPLGIVPVSFDAKGWASSDRSTNLLEQGTVVSLPPPGIDVEKIEFEPGSVLSVPLAFGDLDLSAVGTVTEVLPNGRVLAFGHGMFAQGPIAVPMATGYIHFIMPSLSSSFKLGSSGVIRGAVIRDEHSAIVGSPTDTFTTAPVNVKIRNLTTKSSSEFHYRVVHHQRLTPFIAAAVVLQSITSQRGLPIHNTVRLQGTIQFSHNCSLELDSMVVDAKASDLLIELLPVITTMMHNPHEAMMLDSLQLTVDIEPKPRVAAIVNARIDQAQIAPGDTIGITVQIRPYGQPIIKKRIELVTPPGIADGDYELVICDAQTYTQMLLDNRPHLLATTSSDDLRDVLQRILNVASDALYAVLQLPESGLALGQQELPQLPSSQRAILDTPTNTMATSYVEWIEQVVPIELVLNGSTQFTVSIRQTQEN